MLRVAPAGACAACETSWPENGRQASAPIAQANVVNCSDEACRSAGFWLTTPAAYATAANRHSRTPRTEDVPSPDIDSPTTAAPVNDTAMPASSRGGSPSLRSQPPKSAMRIGPMLTTRADQKSVV